ncbi:cyclic nucleotide-binding domain-containing protein [Dactylosporangium sp. NBC_01737]|uniref:Crp/Fnr family transcriptional regulator n=1 Tax=Dactylosporangium sp. NBC_01737 TaxID=2975959 RepID=UPI002E0DE1EA|nr:cyclic nucleotide-binding domain-containing protein [Dactylosporangium sp. NBC_01737]
MVTDFDLLAAHPFLTGVQPRFVERLARCARRATARAGEHLIIEGEAADTCYLLREGSAELTARVAGRGAVVVDVIGRGQVLGWSWLFPPRRWHFSAVAVEPVLAIALDGPRVRGLCDTEPAFGYDLTNRFLAVMLQRMQVTRMRLLSQDIAPSGSGAGSP